VLWGKSRSRVIFVSPLMLHTLRTMQDRTLCGASHDAPSSWPNSKHTLLKKPCIRAFTYPIDLGAAPRTVSAHLVRGGYPDLVQPPPKALAANDHHTSARLVYSSTKVVPALEGGLFCQPLPFRSVD